MIKKIVLFWVFLVGYFLSGTVMAIHILQPNMFGGVQAESAVMLNGVNKRARYLADVDGGDWFRLNAVNFSRVGADSISMRYAKNDNSTIRLELHIDSLNGPKVVDEQVVTTGGINSFRLRTYPMASVKGIHDVYVKITGPGTLGNIDYFRLGQSQRYFMPAGKADFLQGVTARGRRIEQVDGGDWIRFDDVDLGNGFNNALISYAKIGNSRALVSIHINSPNSPALSIINLTNTGGVNNFRHRTSRMRLVSRGTYNVYFKFHGGKNLAIIDYAILRNQPVRTTLVAGLADASNHVTRFDNNDIGMSPVDNPDPWLQFNNISLSYNTDLTVTFARTSGNPEYIDQMLLEVRRNRLNGPIIGTVDLSDTGGWSNYQTKTISLKNAQGVGPLFFRFTGVGGVNVRSFALNRQGVELGKQYAIPDSPVNACINLSSLEAPASTAPLYWGYQIEAADLAIIADAGFDTVRVPVRWSDYTSNQPPYTIDPGIFDTVDTVIDQAFEYGLKVVLDIHLYEALNEDAAAQRDRFIAMWDQIADHYKHWWDTHLIFEIINEPYDASDNSRGMTISRTDEFNRLALAKIRETNPDRWVVLGTGGFGGMDGLRLSTPPNDPRVLLSLHYYDPFPFTHQGAEFVDEPLPLGVSWGTVPDRIKLLRDFNLAESLRNQFGKPLLIGEFGVVQDGNSDGVGAPIIVPEARRAPWTAVVRSQAEQRNMGWCYWSYEGGFRAYRKEQGIWFPRIRNALLPSAQ